MIVLHYKREPTVTTENFIYYSTSIPKDIVNYFFTVKSFDR